MTTLTGLMLTLIWAGDLGNHVRDGSEDNHMAARGSCSTESKDAVSHLSTGDEYNGDGTQIEKVLKGMLLMQFVAELNIFQCLKNDYFYINEEKQVDA